MFPTGNINAAQSCCRLGSFETLENIWPSEKSRVNAVWW